MRLSDLETVPVVNAGMLISLVRGLVTAAEAIRVHAHRSAKTALGRMRDRGETLRIGHHASPKPKSINLAKPADTAVDRAVGVVESRLSDFEILSGPNSVEAARVHALLFPEGLGFLRFKYKEEWTQVDALLKRIQDERLEASLSTLVGEEFITHLRACQEAYGEALHVTKVDESTATPTLAEPFAATRDALLTYVQVLVAAVKNEELPEADVLRALAPMAKAKQTLASAKKRAAKGEEEEEEEDVGEELPKV